MIIGGTEPMDIGSRQVRPCNDHHGETHKMPFIVMREATADEFIAQCKDYGVTPVRIAVALMDMLYFYDVRLD